MEDLEKLPEKGEWGVLATHFKSSERQFLRSHQGLKKVTDSYLSRRSIAALCQGSNCVPSNGARILGCRRDGGKISLGCVLKDPAQKSSMWGREKPGHLRQEEAESVNDQKGHCSYQKNGNQIGLGGGRGLPENPGPVHKEVSFKICPAYIESTMPSFGKNFPFILTWFHCPQQSQKWQPWSKKGSRKGLGELSGNSVQPKILCIQAQQGGKNQVFSMNEDCHGD